MNDETSEIHDRLRKIEDALLTERAARTANRKWATAAGSVILAWLGITSFYQIPKAVDQSSTGQVAHEAENARNRAVTAADEISKLAVGGAVPLAAVTVIDGAVVIKSKGVDYNTATGVVTFPNPQNMHFVPIVSDLAPKNSEPYITETHFIRKVDVTNQFTVWKKALDTGERNSPPSSFTAIVVGMP